MYKNKYTQCTSIYIKGLFSHEFELEGIDGGSHLCIQIETVPETGPTIRKGFLAIASNQYGYCKVYFKVS